jgi:hypothetical protein
MKRMGIEAISRKEGAIGKTLQVGSTPCASLWSSIKAIIV